MHNSFMRCIAFMQHPFLGCPALDYNSFMGCPTIMHNSFLNWPTHFFLRSSKTMITICYMLITTKFGLSRFFHNQSLNLSIKVHYNPPPSPPLKTRHCPQWWSWGKINLSLPWGFMWFSLHQKSSEWSIM